MNRGHKSGEKLIITYFLLVGLWICGYWATQLSGNYLVDGIATKISESYIVWHVIAEVASGVLALISAFLMLSNSSFGLRMGLFTCGMLLYTGLNSIGWGILQDPGLLALFIITSMGAIFGFFALIGREEL